MESDHSSRKFFESLRRVGIIRRESQWLGGVAAGVAIRYRIDVILVRGLLVALCLLGGFGLILYSLAWAFLPDEKNQIHFEQAILKNWTSGMTGAVILFVLGVGPAPWAMSGLAPYLWPVVIIAAIAFLIFNRSNTKFDKNNHPRPRPTAPSDPGGPDTSFSAQAIVPYREDFAQNNRSHEPDTASDAHADSTAPHQPASQSAYLQEPVMAHQPQNDFNQPPPNKPVKNKTPEAPPLPGWICTIIVGIAVLVIALILSSDYLNIITFPSGAWSVALAVGLLVVGLSLVVAALSKRTSGGLLGLAIPLLVLTVIFGGVNSTGGNNGGISQDGDDYNAVFSSSTIDLRHYSNIQTPTTVEVHSIFSKINLELPNDIPVRVSSEGIFLSQLGEQVNSENSSFPENAPLLTVEVDGVFSSIEISQARINQPAQNNDS